MKFVPPNVLLGFSLHLQCTIFPFLEQCGLGKPSISISSLLLILETYSQLDPSHQLIFKVTQVVIILFLEQSILNVNCSIKIILSNQLRIIQRTGSFSKFRQKLGEQAAAESSYSVVKCLSVLTHLTDKSAKSIPRCNYVNVDRP